MLCSACHRSCKDVCTQAGPKGCLTCNDGWFMDTEQGCSDIDECLTNKTACNENSFCVNSPGSHTCISIQTHKFNATNEITPYKCMIIITQIVIKHVKVVSPTALTIALNALKLTNSKKVFAEVKHEIFLLFHTSIRTLWAVFTTCYLLVCFCSYAWLDFILYFAWITFNLFVFYLYIQFHSCLHIKIALW